jgi:hypothetical protein
MGHYRTLSALPLILGEAARTMRTIWMPAAPTQHRSNTAELEPRQKKMRLNWSDSQGTYEKMYLAWLGMNYPFLLPNESAET